MLIGAIKKFFYGHLKVDVIGKNISVSHINKHLGNFLPQILIYMENTNVSHGKLRSLYP